MEASSKLDQIRRLMRRHGIDAIVLSGKDPHQNESVSGHWRTIRWLTNFSGSSATVAITQEDAILWTDSRYWFQAENQMKNSPFRIFRSGTHRFPTHPRWLRENLGSGDVVGIDEAVFSLADSGTLRNHFDDKDIRLNTKIDFVGDLWTGRPVENLFRAFSLPDKLTGKTRREKIRLIRQWMGRIGADCHVMVSLTDIAWTFNLRGSDIRHSPVNVAYAVIEPDTATLYMDKMKTDPILETELLSDGIVVAGYDDIFAAVSEFGGGKKVFIDPALTNLKLYKALHKTCRVYETQSPATLLKMIKNQTEIRNIRETMVKDGVAMVNFLFWLETGSRSEVLTEMAASEKLLEFRKEQPLFFSNSFETVMAYQDHSAICHYVPEAETDRRIKDEGILLIDSGGQYLGGTTDLTRVIPMGPPFKQIIHDYTLVLKGHIALATAVFPEGTKGIQIDTLARQHLWRSKLNYDHGTGHGVGFFLNVHEGPCCFSSRNTGGILKQGMVLSNEPGLYRKKQYGIRIENLVLVNQDHENEFGRFLNFETLTLCHFEKELMNVMLLSAEEISWINDYHSRVYKSLSPYLNEAVRAWLQKKTQKIC